MNRRHFLPALAGTALALLVPLTPAVTASPAPVPPLPPLTPEQRAAVARLRRAIVKQHGPAVWRRYRPVLSDWPRTPCLAGSRPAAVALLVGLFESVRLECGGLFPFQLSNGAIVRVDQPA